jgi:hypothetical protein
MSTARLPRPLAGLFAGVLPLLLSPCSLTLFVLQHGGWNHALSILAVVERPWGLFFWFSTACALGLAAALFFLASGRDVPLLLPVTLALMPWLAGVGLALYNAQAAMEIVAQVSMPDQLTVLIRATGDQLWILLLGTWASATLLLACVGGLIITGLGGLGSPEEGAASAVIPRLLEALVLLLVAGVGLTHISEDRGLAQVLEALATAEPAEMAAQLEQGARELSGLAALRPWALGALVLGAAVLGAYLLTRRPKELPGLAALGTLALLVASTLWTDSRPLLRMARRIEAVLQPQRVPTGIQLLPFGGNWPVYESAVAVTAQGLTGVDGTRVDWSAGDQALTGFLLHAREEAERRSPRLMSKRSDLRINGWHALALALDERMTTPQLRRLLAAGEAAKLHLFTLLTKRNLDSQGDVSRQLRAVVSSHPFLQRLGALMDELPGAVGVFLPLAFEDEGREYHLGPAVGDWVGEVGTEREVRLARQSSREGHQEMVIALSGPEEAEIPPTKPMPRLYLYVKAEAALIDVVHAVRRAQGRGFLVALTATPPPGELPKP